MRECTFSSSLSPPVMGLAVAVGVGKKEACKSVVDVVGDTEFVG